MDISIDVVKMLLIATAGFLLLSLSIVVVVGRSEKLFAYLVTPKPGWILMIALLGAWIVSMRLSYWYCFQRFTFYGGR